MRRRGTIGLNPQLASKLNLCQNYHHARVSVEPWYFLRFGVVIYIHGGRGRAAELSPRES